MSGLLWEGLGGCQIIPGASTTTDDICDDAPTDWRCTREPGHPGRHMAGTGGDRVVAAWPGAHQPTLADLDSLPGIPADWWIATAGDGDPTVYRPGTTWPEVVLHRADVGAPVWEVFARTLPDRGDCEQCTAVACPRHGGEAA